MILTVSQLYMGAKTVYDTYEEWKGLTTMLKGALTGINPTDYHTTERLALVFVRASDEPERYMSHFRTGSELSTRLRERVAGARYRLVETAVQRAYALANQAEEGAAQLTAQTLQLRGELGLSAQAQTIGGDVSMGFNLRNTPPPGEGGFDLDEINDTYKELEENIGKFLGKSGPSSTSGLAMTGGAYLNGVAAGDNSSCPDVGEVPAVVFKRARALALGGQVQAVAVQVDLAAAESELQALEVAAENLEKKKKMTMFEWLASRF